MDVSVAATNGDPGSLQQSPPNADDSYVSLAEQDLLAPTRALRQLTGQYGGRGIPGAAGMTGAVGSRTVERVPTQRPDASEEKKVKDQENKLKKQSQESQDAEPDKDNESPPTTDPSS